MGFVLYGLVCLVVLVGICLLIRSFYLTEKKDRIRELELHQFFGNQLSKYLEFCLKDHKYPDQETKDVVDSAVDKLHSAVSNVGKELENEKSNCTRC